jgi:hypothetical protein
MSALVLSLLLASAKNSFDTTKREFTQMSANIILLDRELAEYGPETNEVRHLLHSAVNTVLRQSWPADASDPVERAPTANPEHIYQKISSLSPQNAIQRSLQAQALGTSTAVAQTRWLLFEQRAESSIPMPFLVVLVFWLCIIFASFGLYAPRNITVVATLGVCSLSVAGAIFLILELDRPFVGVMKISSAPLRNALAHLSH